MILRNIGRTVAILLTLPTIVVIVFSAAILSLVPALANPENFKAGLAEQNIYEDIVPVFLPIILDSGRDVETNIPLDFSDIKANMSEDDWRAVANDLIPPTWIQAQIENVLDGFYDYLNGAPRITYQINLQPLADRFTGEQGERAITRMTTLSQPCSSDEVDLIRNFDTFDMQQDTLPVCSPANPADRERLAGGYRLLLAGIAEQITEDEGAFASASVGELGFIEQINPEGAAELTINLDGRENSLLEARLFFQTYQLYVPLFYYAPGFMLALIIMFAVHSLKGFARWMGVILLLASVAVMLALLLFSVGIITVPQTSTPDMQNIPVELLELQQRITEGILSAAYAEIGQTVVDQIGGMFLFGLLLLVISFFAKGPQQVIHLEEGSSIGPAKKPTSGG